MDRVWAAICRRQRKAYETWQESSDGWSGWAFQEYLAASKEYDNYFKRLLEQSRLDEVV